MHGFALAFFKQQINIPIVEFYLLMQFASSLYCFELNSTHLCQAAFAQEGRGDCRSTQMCVCLFEPSIKSFTGFSIFRHTEENAEDTLTYLAHVWNWKVKS